MRLAAAAAALLRGASAQLSRACNDAQDCSGHSSSISIRDFTCDSTLTSPPAHQDTRVTLRAARARPVLGWLQGPMALEHC
eukprot:gene11004-biopygen781